MIPQFPEFKKLDLSDKEEIESFTKKFPPYSDFNFVSMWSWDVKGEMRLAWLNDNLAVRFSSYLTGESFYSFLGDTKVDETTRTLIGLSKVLGPKSEINLVPEIGVNKLDTKGFTVIEEREHFDYIYELASVAALKGSQFANKRTAINSFLKKYKVDLKILDIENSETKFDIKKVNLVWLDEKSKRDPYFEVKNELIAMDKFLDGGIHDNIFVIGVFVDGVMAGYTISEKLPEGYAMSHFTKANFSYKGIYDYIMQENAKLLLQQGISFLNYEQDLGLPGLKKSKEGFSTGIFLKQYKVVLS